ncbi:centrosomal protein of 112 kDa isoform X10 [Bubalus bubalis]|uniref:centrosomal protein of 112 kDa isoform X10 n=1 Tax=Bubalus bubalis TaxID=89462 RepID=UPI000DBC9484|nr:centrosomal protein of 112 kDa isoform X10 [Bubalus bubalis]
MEMGSEEEKWEKLDAEFDHFVVDMKPFVLKLPHRSERQRCALWIRKLCEPSGTGTGIPGRKNRNLYAKLLLHMLRRGVLEGPFTQRPEPGTLRALPSYMSIYFDEPNPAQAKGSSADGLPDWVVGELGSSERRFSESRELSSGEDHSLVQSPTAVYREQCIAKFQPRSQSTSPTHREDGQILTPQDCDIHLKKSTLSLDDSDMGTRLNSWNLGIENPRYLRQKPIPVTLMTPKFSLRKSSSLHDDQLLSRMHEKENQMIKELESRVQQLTGEAENSNLQKQKLIQEKLELERCYQITCNELQEVKARYCLRRNTLHKEKDHLVSDYEQNLKLLQTKHDADVNLLKKEHALSAAKASGMIKELEQNICQLKQQLQESELQRKQQLKDQENKFQMERSHLKRTFEKKIHDLQSELDKEKEDAQKKIHKFEEALKEKEERLTRVSEGQRLQVQQADAALEEFKRQVELNSEKVYAEMKEQMEKVEADLTRSKSLREKQSKEFLWQLDDVKQRYEQQIVELKLEHEQEKTHLLQQHKAEKESLVRDHEREVGNLENKLRAANMEHENQIQEFKKRDSQVIADMEAQVHKLREELVSVNSQRKQQLVELGLLREEEKQRAAQDHEAAVSKLKAESEKMRLELKKTHAAETELTLEKANSRLKQIEKEYTQKLAKSSQVIAELQGTVSSLREDSSRQQLAAERRLQEVVRKFEDEKQQLIRENERAVKALQEELENRSEQVRCIEKKLQLKELQSQDQITYIRQEYETKFKGLMPASLRQELEDTISSLKSQVNFLQKRASVLQDELTAYQSRR